MAAGAAPLLKRLAPERLRETLLDLLRDWKRFPYSIPVASMKLAEFKEERAVPLLIRIICDEGHEWEKGKHMVAQVIGWFGPAGLAALAEQLDSGSPAVRRRAAIGLMYSNRAEARDAFEKLLSDSNADIRQTAEMALKILPLKRA